MQTIVFTGGGTAGHIMPNLALIERLCGSYNCVYFGTDGMERELCAARGIKFYTVPAVKLRRDAVFKNAAVPFKLLSCVKHAKKELSDLRPSLVFSKGGFAALPTVLAAQKLKIPLVAHESDLTPGIVTKLSAKKAKRTLCAFAPCADAIKNGVYVGTPMRRELFSAAPLSYIKKDKPVLLIMGGSSGSTAINDCAAAALPTLLSRYNVVHVTGKNKSVGVKYPNYTELSFCDAMGALYKTADVAVTRAGANSLFELTALKVPCLAIPLEKASRGDQLKNAEYFASKNAISVLREADMTPESLVAAVDAVYEKRDRYAAAMSELKTDGTERICRIIRDVLNSDI